MKKKVLISFIFVILGFVLSFMIHEFSHFLFLELMGGTTKNISIGLENYVTGYIEPSKISIIALSSIFVPLILSGILVFIKSLYIQIFCGTFTILPFMNCLLGLIMNVIEKDISVRATYDVVLAIDNVAHPMGSLMFTMFCFLLSIAIIIYNGKYIVDNF